VIFGYGGVPAEILPATQAKPPAVDQLRSEMWSVWFGDRCITQRWQCKSLFPGTTSLVALPRSLISMSVEGGVHGFAKTLKRCERACARRNALVK